MIRVANQANGEEPKPPEGAAAPARFNNELLREVRVSLEARLGQAAMTVEEMMALKAGAVVTLNASLADHVDLYLNGTLVARGEIVAVGERYGVRIVDIAPKP
jgi:flagellar motor switch protein FliN/FliY